MPAWAGRFGEKVGEKAIYDEIENVPRIPNAGNCTVKM